MASTQSLGPDAVFLNAGGIITMAPDSPTVLDRNLTAIAVREGVIVGLGSDDAITQMAPDALVANLEGAVVMPGLIDCHNHFLRTALDWERLQLGDVRSTEELLDVVAERARETPPASGSFAPAVGTRPTWPKDACPRRSSLTRPHPTIRSTCPGADMWW